MKKLIVLISSFFLLSIAPIFANEIEVQPTMFSRSNAQDRVWVGTFQLVWNDFIDKILFNPVRFKDGNPSIVNDLNKKSFTTDDISDESYYKFAGKVKKNTKKQIKKAIRKKFKETSDILDKLNIDPRSDMYLIYAMLKKDFEFLNAFDKLGNAKFNNSLSAEYFGINKDSDKKLGEGVTVLFYNNKNDFAVKLATLGKDEVYLYKNYANKPFNFIYADMMKKQKYFKGETKFRKVDELKIPNIKFSEEKMFEELMNKRIMGTNLVISQAIETVKFDMNNKGAKLKSEAAMAIMTTSLRPQEELSPRLFYFDSTFNIFLKEKDKKNPYFALRVNDIRKFQRD